MNNPLGTLPASTSARWSIDWIDFLKIVRIIGVLLVSEALKQGVGDKLLHMTYIWHAAFLPGGMFDFTPYVVVLLIPVIEFLRRWATGAPPLPPMATPPAS